MRNKSKSAAKTVSAETKAALVGSTVPAENAIIPAEQIAAITATETESRKAKTERLAAQRKANETGKHIFHPDTLAMLSDDELARHDEHVNGEPKADNVETTTASEAHAGGATVLDNETSEPVSEPRGLARDATGIVRNATNFDQYSDRDTAYLAFFGSVMRQHGDTATLKQIFDAGSKRDKKSYNPLYVGSAKATDVGAINRLKKAGYILASSDGNTLTATDKAKASAAYLGTK